MDGATKCRPCGTSQSLGWVYAGIVVDTSYLLVSVSPLKGGALRSHFARETPAAMGAEKKGSWLDVMCVICLRFEKMYVCKINLL